MTGSLLQIVSTGLKDVFLTIDPQITFFKIVYMRHTPFSIDLIEETFNTIPNFGDTAFSELTKNGDLISNIFLKIVLPNVQISNISDSSLITDYSNLIITNNSLHLNDNVTNIISTYNTTITNFIIFISSSMIYWRTIKNTINNLTCNYTTIITLINNNRYF